MKKIKNLLSLFIIFCIVLCGCGNSDLLNFDEPAFKEKYEEITDSLCTACIQPMLSTQLYGDYNYESWSNQYETTQMFNDTVIDLSTVKINDIGNVYKSGGKLGFNVKFCGIDISFCQIGHDETESASFVLILTSGAYNYGIVSKGYTDTRMNIQGVSDFVSVYDDMFSEGDEKSDIKVDYYAENIDMEYLNKMLSEKLQEYIANTSDNTENSDKGTGKSISTTVLETGASTKNTIVQTTTKQAATSETITKVKTTEAKSDSETYSITFEADELIEEAGLQLNGHVGVAVLSNLTCSNGNANIETETVYIYDSLVKVEVTGAEAGEVVLGGTITTYGLDMYQGETVSYPADSGVFLISKAVGENLAEKPYVEGYVETYSLSEHDGSKIRLYLDGDFSGVSAQIYNQEYTSEVEFYSKEDFNDYIEMNFNPFAQPPSVVYITPYNDSGVAGDVITCDIPTETSGTIQTGDMSYPVDNMKGQINCHGGTVAGFTTEYVVNGGEVGKVRSSLGDTWHVTAKNACDNYGVTWYELWDSDDGDYYGWVDENFIDFY